MSLGMMTQPRQDINHLHTDSCQEPELNSLETLLTSRLVITFTACDDVPTSESISNYNRRPLILPLGLWLTLSSALSSPGKPDNRSF